MNDDNASTMKRQWWTLAPGARSFNAKEYGGFKESAQLVQNALLDAAANGKHYDFILGHSQGAILLSALITSRQWNDLFSTRTSEDKKVKEPLGYILNGCAWPNPYTEQLESFRYQMEKDNTCNTNAPSVLFVIGSNDSINPPESAMRVRTALQKGDLDVDSCHHDGGHAVPVKDAAALNEIMQWITNISVTADATPSE